MMFYTLDRTYRVIATRNGMFHLQTWIGMGWHTLYRDDDLDVLIAML